MRHLAFSSALLLALAAAAPAARAASPRDSLVVTTDWVAQHLNDPNVVILHVGEPGKYAEAHVPGARLVDFGGNGWAAPTGQLEMPAPDDLHATLAALGVGDRTRIVVYQAQQWYSPSTRIVMTLNWAGLGDRTVLMDGGLAKWTREKRATSTETPTVTPGTLSPLRVQPVIASIDEVQAAISTPGISIVDGRDKVFYDGTRPAGPVSARVSGHIPSAKSVVYSSIYNLDETLKSDDELQKLFAEAGVKTGDLVIAYCHVGQQATSTILGARLAGFRAKLFDGSMDEWATSKRPVETIKK